MQIEVGKGRAASGPDDVRLGMFVQEQTSGVTGTAVSKHFRSDGTVQYGIQTVGDGSSYPEPYTFDWNTLNIIHEGISARAVPPPAMSFKIGDQVKDKLSGFKGTLRSYGVFFNGCISCTLNGPIQKDGKFEETAFMMPNLELVKAAKEEVKPADFGGPVRKDIRPI